MQRVRFYINGQEAENYPLDIKNMRIVVNWVDGHGSPQINFSEMVLKGADAQQVMSRELSQLGFYNGIPFRIDALDSNGNGTTVFDGYIDLAENPPTFIGCDEVKVSLKEKQGGQWFEIQKDTFSFKFLEEERVTITQSDFVQVPYIINYIPDVLHVSLLSISVYLMVKELAELIKDTAQTISEATNASTPIPGFSPTGPTVSVDVGAIILASLNLAARIIYSVAMIIHIKNMVTEIFEQLVPLKRFHTGIRLKTLMEKGCQELGLNFESTIFDGDYGNVVYIPSKYAKGNLIASNFDSGVPEVNDSGYFFGAMFDLMRRMFNATYKIQNGTLRLERWDYWRQSGNYQFPANYEDQDRRRSVKSFNTNELKSGYYIQFSYDEQDQNTLDNLYGINHDAITYLQTELPDYKNLFGNEEVRLPFALAVRKNKLTIFEEVFKSFAKVVDKVTGAFGGGTNFATRIEQRVGAMYLSDHKFSVPKLVLMSGSTISPQNREIVRASYLWNNYHFINSFVVLNSKHNQHILYKSVKDRFCFEKFVNLLQNNFGVDEEGNDAEAERLEWEIKNDVAYIDYRVNKLYDTNLRIKTIEGGEKSQGTVE